MAGQAVWGVWAVTAGGVEAVEGGWGVGERAQKVTVVEAVAGWVAVAAVWEMVAGGVPGWWCPMLRGAAGLSMVRKARLG